MDTHDVLRQELVAPLVRTVEIRRRRPSASVRDIAHSRLVFGFEGVFSLEILEDGFALLFPGRGRRRLAALHC